MIVVKRAVGLECARSVAAGYRIISISFTYSQTLGVSAWFVWAEGGIAADEAARTVDWIAKGAAA